MVSGMATKKYTVTLPEELAEEIRAEVGHGGLSRYVTNALRRQREQDHLEELVDWFESEHGEISEEDLERAERENHEIRAAHAASRARLAAERKAS